MKKYIGAIIVAFVIVFSTTPSSEGNSNEGLMSREVSFNIPPANALTRDFCGTELMIDTIK